MIKAVLLDLDGTVFLGKSAIQGAEDALERMRESGIKVFFLTNASTRSRRHTVEKLAKMGIIAYEGEVYGSAYMVADYIAANHPGKSVYCLSERGIQDELLAKGIRVVEDSRADIVAVGLDRTITYEKLSIAFRAISNGALFIASNDDATFPMEDGFLPGSGAMVAAVERSTGKKPLVLGKPNKYGVELLLRENKLKKGETLIVGDRLETDILTGKHSGIKTVLVLTGVAKKEDVEKLKKAERPDIVLDSVAGLPGLLSGLD
jgi:4-nitrophenyl phosphatase